MSGLRNRSRRLVPSLAIGLVLGGGACGSSDRAGVPGTAASGGTTSTGGLGNGGNAGGGRTGSGGESADASTDTWNGNTSDDAGNRNGSSEVGSDATGADSGRADHDGERLDGSAPDVQVSVDLASMPDLPARLDAAMPFWVGDFVANCTPPTVNGRQQIDGHHHAGDDCMTSGCHRDPELAAHYEGTDCRGSGCHANGSPDGSGAPAFLFGGTVYQPGLLAAAPSVEVAVRTMEGFFSACSASNGNFWRLAASRTAPPLTWPASETRVRTMAGETAMKATPTAGCNAALCHSDKQKLTQSH